MKIFAPLYFIVLLLAGCASSTGGPHADWIQGQIVSLSDGVVMPMQIQKKWVFGGTASGGIAAQNPKTGEQLEGKYTGMLEAYSHKANAQATLVGTKGTTISFQMEIMAGWSPHGFGQGIDGQGHQYRLQF